MVEKNYHKEGVDDNEIIRHLCNCHSFMIKTKYVIKL